VNFFSFFAARKPRKSGFSDEEFKTAVSLGRKEGQISDQEEDMISHVLEFKDTRASEILTARIDIKGIDAGFNQDQALRFLRRIKHSKVPVYEGTLDNITGVLYSRDVFLHPEKHYSEFVREPLFIPESKGIDDVLKVFVEKNERIAIVVDEYGGTEGLVTFEDIAEEIFGEMYDEFETPQEPVEKVADNTWKVYGKTPIKTVNLELDLHLPEEEDTIAGFLLSRIERIPRANETFTFNNIEFVVERATARRIVSILLRLK
jgi:putative hemolysin